MASLFTPFRDLLHAANLRHGTDGFTSPPKEGVLRDFKGEKILSTPSAGFELANLGTKGQHVTPRPPKPPHLSIENKLLIYKAVIKPIWSYVKNLCGCPSKTNTVIMQGSQYKILRAIPNELRYVTNHTPHTDFNIPYESDVIHEKYHNFFFFFLFFGPCIFITEGRTDQRNAQINFSLINLLLFKLLRHVSAT